VRNRPLIASKRVRGTPNTTTPSSTPIGCACWTTALSGAFNSSRTVGHASMTSSGSNVDVAAAAAGSVVSAAGSSTWVASTTGSGSTGGGSSTGASARGASASVATALASALASGSGARFALLDRRGDSTAPREPSGGACGAGTGGAVAGAGPELPALPPP